MLEKTENSSTDQFERLTRFLNGMKLLIVDPIREIAIGYKMSALPTYLLLFVGIVLNLSLMFHLDDRILLHYHHRTLKSGLFRDVLVFTSMFWGYWFWGCYRMGLRGRIRTKLKKAFINSGLETRLKETPEFRGDFPIDDVTRKLRLRGRGIPLSAYSKAKETIESELNIDITKIEHPANNRELVDIIYTTQAMPDFWALDHLNKYKDFTIPIGMSRRGEITISLKKVPHILVAGESGGGKSSFIRMIVTVLLVNNQDIEVIYIDFKRGMENQMFDGFENTQVSMEASDAASKMSAVKQTMENRMLKFKEAQATSLEMYNRSSNKKGPREKRIIVVVDEIAELMPTFKGKHNSNLSEVSSVINQISRMGRAVGINLVIGVQKPDTKNLDPTIKANLSGILCFPVNHFSQSTVVLGNARACELNAEYKGRAIWKRGVEMTEVQTPLLTEDDVSDAKDRVAKYWSGSGSEAAPQRKTQFDANAGKKTSAN